MSEDQQITIIDKAWVEVILPLALPTSYTYEVPSHFIPQLIPGIRVEVIFGKSRKYAAIVKQVLHQAPAYPTKPVLNILDNEPLVYSPQLKLWNWLARYYMCTEGEVMNAALPAHFKLSSETILVYNEELGDDFSSLNDEEFMVAEALLIRKQLKAEEIQQILDTKRVYPVIKSLLDKGVCFAWEKMNDQYVPKKEKYVLLAASYREEDRLAELLNGWKGAPKQLELLLAFLHLERTEGQVVQSELLKKAGASPAQLKALCEKEVLVVEKRIIDRLPVMSREIIIDFTLSTSQQDVLDDVKEQLHAGKVALLHGATGSGKTLIYIKIIEEIFRSGKQVLYLLPEIALTAQIIRRLQKHFGGNIAIYHSKFNNQERIELWNKVRNGEIRIILGARSAVFLPFRDLGLVIVDEEHDPSYKQQDPAPRYNARDAAVYAASLFKAKVLLGSATPSLESYANAKAGKYALVEMPERYGGIDLPLIQIINPGSGKGKMMISDQLKEAIEAALQQKEQVILFQNRRGYNPYLICASCGHIPQCVHCDVSLTLHKHSNKLHCHYCGSTYPRLINCPACGTNNWMEKTFGTEKIEEQLGEFFPDARIARMDVDSVKGKNAHDELIHLFEQHRLDILVGTQMVVKGLDFEKVSLVGILDADGLLSFADFRVNERAFQLMEQVSGRAGRKSAGKVLIQAMNRNHPVLQYVSVHDYPGFFSWELHNRQEFFYPPYSRLVHIKLKHKEKERVEEGSGILSEMLRVDLKNAVTGPATPVVGRIRNLYIREILLKLDKPSASLEMKKVIRNHIDLFLSQKQFKSIQVITDVDPY